MKFNRTVVVSTTNNPDYYFYLPYVEKAWNNYGWNVACMVTQEVDVNDLEKNNTETLLIQLPKIDRLREATIAQAGRLYASNYISKDQIIMTSDMDLIPLADYWNPEYNNVTIYGHDLTWFSFFPMGYCAMNGYNWDKYLQLTYNTGKDMLRDAEETQIAFSENWEEWWNFDWDLLTKRLMPFKDQLTFVNRGQIDIAGATLAKGRVDRYNWIETQKQPDWIDAHCENNNSRHPEKMEKFLKVFEKIHGKL